MCKPKVPKVSTSATAAADVAQAAPFIPVDALESVSTGPRIADVDALKPRRTNPLRIVGAGRPVTTPSTAVTGGNRAGGVTVLKARAPTPGVIPYRPAQPTAPARPPTTPTTRPVTPIFPGHYTSGGSAGYEGLPRVYRDAAGKIRLGPTNESR